MSPMELLETVKARFSVLLADEDSLLEGMLRQALVTYQDLGGYVSTLLVSEPISGLYPYPDDYLQIVSVTDGRGAIMLVDPVEDGLFFYPQRYAPRAQKGALPIRIKYLINFRLMDLEKGKLPERSIYLMGKYLESLINIENTRRRVRVAIASKTDTSQFPDEQSLYLRKQEIEREISEQKSIIEGHSIF